MSTLNALLRPQSVAIVGATALSGDKTMGASAANVLLFMQNFGYPGRIYPVNPRHDTLSGLKCYPSVLDIPDQVDAAVIAVSADRALAAAEECGQKGIPLVVMISSGFADEGPEGVERQQKLMQLRQRHGFRISGPNCNGMLSTTGPIMLTTSAGLVADRLIPGHIGLISQSGAVKSALLARAYEQGFGFSWAISSGNEVDLGLADYMEMLIDDPETRVIACFLESIRFPGRFRAMAEKARRRGKPVVVFKVGRSPEARASAASHTGSLVGDDDVYETLFRQLGVIRVNDLDQLLLTALVLCDQRVTSQAARGRGVGIISNAGGIAGTLADLVGVLKVPMATLEGDTANRLRELLPSFAGIGNPTDMTAVINNRPDQFKPAVQTFMNNPDSDLTIVGISMLPQYERFATDLVELYNEATKPLLVCWYGGLTNRRALEILRQGGVPTFESPFECLSVAADVLRHRARTAPVAAATQIGAGLEPAPQRVLDPMAIIEAMRSEGLPVAQYVVLGEGGNTGPVWDSLKAPVALKLMSPLVSHKLDVGGVRLGLSDDTDLAQAAGEMTVAFAAIHPGRSAILVAQQMVAGVAELIVGITDEGELGLMVQVGWGGTRVELYQDICRGLTPLDEAAVRGMLGQLRVSALLNGYRGAPTGDVESAVRAVLDLIRFAEQRTGQFGVIEVNPLIVGPAGQGSWIVDARWTPPPDPQKYVP